ncbi:MAG: CDP-glycerol glycerophosphotransferase family protein, partial [Eubacterium sp.]|nr:CDP-glycerol glycerophosphotransferase family protein [Eubacterium sp.]
IHAASQNHKIMFYRQGKAWNYLISANRFSTEVFERAFCVPREKIIEVGYPRNDILYSEHADEIAKEVKKEFGIPEGKRVILYAPTWRDNQFYGKGKYKFTLAMDLERMRKEFGKDSVILLRTHYYIADSLDLTGLEDFVYNGSTYNDVSRLYLASDICITDYSSVFFDYANLRRPMLFFAYDYEDYKDEIRGMYFDMNTELPGPILQTNDELVDALHHIDVISEKYKERYDRFYDKFCHVDDGHAAKRAIDIVFEGAKPTFAETEE